MTLIQNNELPEPYSNEPTTHNMQSRKVYCRYCKYELVTNLPGPKCGQCHSNLITMIAGLNDIMAGQTS